jgi:uncharacterized protein YlxW (UPF0749 family)
MPTESTPPTPTQPARRELTGRARLRSALVPRASRRQLLAGTLCALLGFAGVAQDTSRNSDSVLDTARQSDLVQILDAQSQLADRLEAELAGLQASYDDLLTDGDQQQTALEQARARRETLGILAGTLPAHGRGVVVVIADPNGDAQAIRILGALEELRNAGAEVLQIDDIRVVASTYVLDGPNGPEVDGIRLSHPYEIRAIGDPETLATALAIPGGVIDTFAADGLAVTVSTPSEVVVDALRAPSVPQYARPATEG